MKFLILFLLPFAVQAQTYNCRVLTQTQFNATTLSTVAIAENRSRRCLMVQNMGDSTIIVKFGSSHSGNEGVMISSKSTWQPIIIPVNSLYLKSFSTSPGVNATIIEGK